MTPLQLVIQHQDHMNKLLAQIQANAGCIRQLMLGRKVVRRSDRTEFVVTESRLGLSGSVTLHGKATGKKRTTMIGGVRDIDIVEKQS